MLASIVDSETSYLDSLRRLVKDYEQPLLEASPKILPKHVVRSIFFKMNDILQVRVAGARRIFSFYKLYYLFAVSQHVSHRADGERAQLGRARNDRPRVHGFGRQRKVHVTLKYFYISVVRCSFPRVWCSRRTVRTSTTSLTHWKLRRSRRARDQPSPSFSSSASRPRQTNCRCSD